MPRVLVFDSGVGGLSIAGCLHAAMPGLQLLYVADTAGFPYGDRTEETVISRCAGLVEQAMTEIPVDLVVVACNTASTVVLPTLRQHIQVPVVGVVPAIKPAAKLSINRQIGILATPATVRRPYTDELIRQFAADCVITRVGHPGLVQWAEDKASGIGVPLDALSDATAPLAAAGVDTVVLGCTHYPLILDELKLVLPQVLHWVDSGEAIARRVAFLLGEGGFTVSDLEKRAADRPVEARFSGAAPTELADFLSVLGLGTAYVETEWSDGLT
ncbi:glutamate racemase [Marinobacter nanhaiticus D15-8W]|uniref:glutamate racemase n=1 Tax=Marinobacter nanhaiticus TaxID=1305740 RepID=UPI0002C92EAA|nr:glutamate racemase [Marinobacter nanhaiticus]BES72459.1 glutamate racemase [Marinobacter nanhaiticus D15-8W]